MASGITIKVELKPMYIDYIKSIYKAKDHGDIFASETTNLGIMIKSLLRKRPVDYMEPDPSDHITIQLPDYTDLNNEYNNYLSENSCNMIRAFVRKKFFFDLHEHLEDLKAAGYPVIKSGILNFCEIHNIHPDHFKYDSLKREYLRYRKKRKPKKSVKITSVFLAVLSFSCPFLVLFLSNLTN